MMRVVGRMPRVVGLIVFLFLGTVNVLNAAGTFNTDSLLHVLDEIVAGRTTIEDDKRRSITMSRHKLSMADGDKAVFSALGEMFRQYRRYRLDSALYYARQRVVVAKRMGDSDSLSLATMNEADGLKGLGRFVDGLAVLHSLPIDEVCDINYYYYLLHSITLSIYKEQSDADEAEYYEALLHSYRDAMSKIDNKDMAGKVVNQSELLKEQGKYDEALKVMTDFMRANWSAVEHNATFWCTLSGLYKIKGNTEAEMYYLAMAAIIDKRNCVKTYTSLQDLALLLNEEGDSERAYRYITCAMKDIMSGNARSRLIQVSQCMPIILDAYTQMQERERRQSILFDVVVSVLLLCLALIMVKLRRRNRKLSAMQLSLDAKNKELTVLNENLSVANSRLGESNRIKETYIAYLFKICTEYIDEMDKFRISLARKLKGGQISDIKTILARPVADEALKDFLRRFDKIFLELFPTFVEDFNRLLQPGAEIVPKEAGTLNTELRIYALVRLGINDSTKIASFLHYSPQTVYNYRNKVRNRAAVSKEMFVEAVQNL